MKHEGFLADSCRAIYVISAVVLVAGTSAALAQTPAMDKKHSTMPGMAAGGELHGSMGG